MSAYYGTIGSRQSTINGLTIMLDGELYNQDDIKKDLADSGIFCHNQSDEKLILWSYINRGEGCLDLFDGVFAFSIWDENNQKLFFARDHFGIKNLYYKVVQGSIVIGSDLKKLLDNPMVEARIDENSIAELILLGPGKPPNSAVLKEIYELPRATFGYFSDGKLDLYEYWKLKSTDFSDTEADVIQKVKELVTDSIKRRLKANTPICAFLSGGLDSSIITAIAANEAAKEGKSFHSFSVNYLGNDKNFVASRYQPNSDAVFIELMKQRFGLIHEEIVLDTPELLGAIYNAVDARGLPGMADIDSSLLLFCQEVRKSFFIALSGEGSDEIFSGYPWYTDQTMLWNNSFPWMQAIDYRAGFLRKEYNDAIVAQKFIDDHYTTAVANADIAGITNAEDIRIKQLMLLNINWFMQTLCTRNNKMGSFANLNVRVPFCEKNIAEYAYNIPKSIKLKNNTEKASLRAAFKDTLPTEIFERKKSPYPKTHNPEFLRAVTKEFEEMLSSYNEPIFDILDRSRLIAFIGEQDLSKPWYGQLMQKPQTIAYFLQLNYWLKTFKVRI